MWAYSISTLSDYWHESCLLRWLCHYLDSALRLTRGVIADISGSEHVWKSGHIRLTDLSEFTRGVDNGHIRIHPRGNMTDTSESAYKVLSNIVLAHSYHSQLACEGAARDCLDPLVDRLEPKSANSVLRVLWNELCDSWNEQVTIANESIVCTYTEDVSLSLTLHLTDLKKRSTGFNWGEYYGLNIKNAFISRIVLLTPGWRWIVALSMSKMMRAPLYLSVVRRCNSIV
jgi:hypothetical protein